MLHDKIIVLALQEDIGHGDLTTESIVDKNLEAVGTIQAQEDLVVCGLEVAGRVFHLLDPDIQFHTEVADGEKVKAEKVLARVTGSAGKLLTAERVALNFLQHLSGIATRTFHYVDIIRGTGAQVIDTRKTTPGLRDLEKYAVRCGGGRNHRFGLSDGILIKDNHLQIAGGIKQAVQSARRSVSHLLKVEVEIESLDQIDECLAVGVDCILLDNMNAKQLHEAVKLIDHRCLTEASGRIRLENIRKIAETGVDLISVGALTHTVQSVDIHMEISG